MRSNYLFLVFIVGLNLGCAATIPKSTPPVMSQQLVVGSDFEIELRNAEGPKVSYVGKAIEVTSDSVTLDNAMKRVEVSGPAPIPLLGKLFPTKSVGGKLMESPVTIARDEIAFVLGIQD